MRLLVVLNIVSPPGLSWALPSGFIATYWLMTVTFRKNYIPWRGEKQNIDEEFCKELLQLIVLFCLIVICFLKRISNIKVKTE
jgi:hypothetical protein